MDKPAPSQPPACLRCQHYFVTYDPAKPRGCKVFEIKTASIPAYEVFKATGRHCPSWEKNPKIKD